MHGEQMIDLPDAEATNRLGRALGERLFAGAVVGLVGTLGAGKTHLVRAIAEGLRVPRPAVVTSPTFVLMQEYHGRLPLYHFDVYRLPSPEAFAELGSQEQIEGDGVSLVEWADRVTALLPPDHLRIELTITGTDSRRATLAALGPRHAPLLFRPLL